MKAIEYSEVAPTLLDNDKARRVAARVVLGKNDGADNFCMRVFEIGTDGYTPKHSHAWEHEMFCHAGHGEVLCDGHRTPIRPGSVVLIPGDVEHQVRNNGTELLVMVCLVPSFAPEL